MDFKIAGKKALVCAASKGLGKAMALALAEEGVELFLCSRTKDELGAVAQEMEQRFGREIFYDTCDLSEHASREQLIESVKRVFGRLDILIYNVGGPRPTKAEETPLSDWERGFASLFKGMTHLILAFLPGMKEQRWGRILAVTSLAVMEPIPTLAVSNAMRAAATGMLKTLSDEVAAYNICINCIAPGIIHTDRTEERIEKQMEQSGATRELCLAEYVRSIPAGRMGTPEEFASVACFLCSDRASYVTGSTICVDGGKRRSAY